MSSRDETSAALRLSEVLAGLTAALDITEGQPEGHSVRSCMIGMRIAEALQLSDDVRGDLLYALLLKDLGCSSNAARVCYLFGTDDREAKRGLKLAPWTSRLGGAAYAARTVLPGAPIWARFRKLVGLKGAARELVEIRCERGAELAGMLGLPENVRDAIRCLDEHWNGDGHPRGLEGEEIPLSSRIMALAQTVEVFFTSSGPETALRTADERSGTWFDPGLVRVLRSLHRDRTLWTGLRADDLLPDLLSHEPAGRIAPADDENLDRIARVFSWVIDAKSPWTLLHSENVARIARGMAIELGLDSDRQRALYRAGLLHDIGKLAVSNLILDKPGKLTDEEWAVLREHPAHSQRILERVGAFAGLSEPAASHHERLDGTGYHRGLTADALDTASRVLAIADRFEAMSAYRPYRGETPVEKVMDILAGDRGRGICGDAFEALERYLAKGRANDGLAPDSLAAARRGGGRTRIEWLEDSSRRALSIAATP